MYIIYKVTSPSGKVYIGKTIRGLEARKAQHLSSAKHGSSFSISRAIRKYGDLLIWEVIDSAETSGALDLLEISWIKYCGAFGNGMNLTRGGGGWRKYETREEFELAYKAWWKEYRQMPKYKAYYKAYRNTPEYKAISKAYRNTPERRASMKAYMKAYQDTPEYKACDKARRSTPERIAYMKAYMKEYRQTPKYKACRELNKRRLYEKNIRATSSAK